MYIDAIAGSQIVLVLNTAMKQLMNKTLERPFKCDTTWGTLGAIKILELSRGQVKLHTVVLDGTLSITVWKGIRFFEIVQKGKNKLSLCVKASACSLSLPVEGEAGRAAQTQAHTLRLYTNKPPHPPPPPKSETSTLARFTHRSIALT